MNLILPLARKIKGRVLDVACGTGRITLPLARAGYNVTGVDIHEQMMLEGQRKAEREGLTIEWVLQDCTKLNLDHKYEIATMTGNAFQHLLTNDEQDRFFESLSRNLENNGLLIFDTRNPRFDELGAEIETDSELTLEKTLVDEQGRTCEVYYASTYNPLTQIQHYQGYRCFYESEEWVEERHSSISLRYTHPQELQRLLQQYNFELLQFAGDWKGSPLTAKSRSIVVVCRKMNV